MIRQASLPKVLLLLAAFVFFSANTVYFVEGGDKPGLRAQLGDPRPVYHFEYDHVRDKGPYLNARSAIAVNYSNGDVLYTKNADTPRPIASISKLVAAMVLIDQEVNWDSTQTITKEDAYRSSKSRLRVGYELTLRDLLYCALMNSDNRATRALARACSGTIEAFAEEMNRKALSLGLKQTSFVEPTGLSSNNVSTASEVAKILHYAHDYEMIARITAMRSQKVKVVNRKGRTLQMANTNLMIYSPYKVLSGKTGYIRAADYCLTTLLKNSDGDMVTLVVLGVPGDRLRFRQCRKLANWAFEELKEERSEALASR
ncbi:serine hydrolase [bacterium]|nr:serine hydrolase [bacterium]